MFEQGVEQDFDLGKKSFGPGQIYKTLIRVKTYDNLHYILRLKIYARKVNKHAFLEYESLKQSDL